MQENIPQLNLRDLNKKINLPFDSIGHVQQIVQPEKSKTPTTQNTLISE